MRGSERRRRDQAAAARRAGRRSSGSGSTSSAASGSSGGRIPGSRRASIVLPIPGGPARSRLWPPAAAISSTRLARSWPRTSPRSGTSAGATGRARLGRGRIALAAEVRDRLDEVLDRHGLDAGERDLGSRLGRADEAPGAVPPRALGRGERARHRAQTPVERELADRCVPGERARRQLTRGGEHRQRDREVEPRSLLAQVGGREVDGDPAQRPLELGGRDTASHPLARLRFFSVPCSRHCDSLASARRYGHRARQRR